MTHSWKGKQSTSAKKEENSHMTRFKNNSEEMIRVSRNVTEIGLLQVIRLQTFGDWFAYSLVLLVERMNGPPS